MLPKGIYIPKDFKNLIWHMQNFIAVYSLKKVPKYFIMLATSNILIQFEQDELNKNIYRNFLPSTKRHIT